MVSIEKYQGIIKDGLLLDHYFLLCRIRNKEIIPESGRVKGFLNLLEKKGYINDKVLTSKGISIIDDKVVPDKSKVKFDYAEWVIQLHKKCEDKLQERTGKRQIRDKLGGKAYPFLPNPTDLGKVILRAVGTYKLKDFDKIEKTILRYVDQSAKNNSWFPILGYYIMKGTAAGGSTTSMMVTDMESGEEEDNNNASIHIV